MRARERENERMDVDEPAPMGRVVAAIVCRGLRELGRKAPSRFSADELAVDEPVPVVVLEVSGGEGAREVGGDLVMIGTMPDEVVVVVMVVVVVADDGG